jgi:hypothetical protein
MPLACPGVHLVVALHDLGDAVAIDVTHCGRRAGFEFYRDRPARKLGGLVLPEYVFDTPLSLPEVSTRAGAK